MFKLLARKDIKPIEEGNARYINEVCNSISIAMFQYEQITCCYSEEPVYIRLRLNKNEKLITYQQILRFRYIVPNDRINSWMIYSGDREWPFKNSKQCGLIIRSVIWDRKNDTKLIIKGNPTIKERKRWPTIYINNIYLSSGCINGLIG